MTDVNSSSHVERAGCFYCSAFRCDLHNRDHVTIFEYKSRFASSFQTFVEYFLTSLTITANSDAITSDFR